MNLAEAFFALAQAGCRIKVEAGGSIVLDVPRGRPPVPRSVLEALAAHRETLSAVLGPAPDRPTPRPTRRRPYATQTLAIKSEEVRSSSICMPPDVKDILARARARVEMRRATSCDSGHVVEGMGAPSATTPDSVEAADICNDGIPF
jgi:hypothetical protein